MTATETAPLTGPLTSEVDAVVIGAGFAGMYMNVKLRDEGEAYAAALEAAGVPVDVRRHAGQTHGFFTILVLPGSERGFQQVVKAVQACTVAHAKQRTATGGAR